MSAPLTSEATRVSAPGEDHLGRVRIAATLGLPAPAAAPADEPAPVDLVPAGHLTVARAAARVLAAVGPLDLPALATVIARSRRFRSATRCPTVISLPRRPRPGARWVRTVGGTRRPGLLRRSGTG